MNERIMSNPKKVKSISVKVIDVFAYMILHQSLGVNASPENKDKSLPSVLRKRAQSKFDLLWSIYIYHIYQD